MNYQTFTGLTALVATTLALSTTSSANAAVNSSQNPTPNASRQLIAQTVGQASFYGNNPGEGGPKTANGEMYNPGGLASMPSNPPLMTRFTVPPRVGSLLR